MFLIALNHIIFMLCYEIHSIGSNSRFTINLKTLKYLLLES